MQHLKPLILLSLLILTVKSYGQDFTPTGGTFCKGEAVEFNISTTDLVYINFGDGYETVADNSHSTFQHRYSKDGDYVVTLLDPANPDNVIVSHSIKIAIAPTVTLANDTKHAEITTTVENADGESYLWFFNGTETQNTDNSLFYLETGNYDVVVKNSNGCADTASIHVTARSQESTDSTSIIVLNNVLTPGLRDGINDILFIKDVGDYENPCIVKIFDRKGKLVFSSDNYSNANGFQGLDDNGNELFAGTYYYIIKSEGRKGISGFVDILR